MNPLISRFFIIANYKTLFIVILSIIVTHLSYELGYHYDMPLTPALFAVAFPVVFTINSAYWRRERALQRIAEFKSAGLAIYLAARDWSSKKNPEVAKHTQEHLIDIYEALSTFLLSSGSEVPFNRQAVYDKFSKFSTFIQSLKNEGIRDAELSRIDSYLHSMIEAFDRIKNIFEYRTPVALSACGKLFILLFPIIYAPYFASRIDSYPFGLPYVLALLFSFVLVSLDNIQDLLESPYDQVGEDDIKLNIDEFNIYTTLKN